MGLTDFAGAVPDADRTGLEAALQSAGLLDAWILPDGTVSAADDVVLGPVGTEVKVSLSTVLEPAVGTDDRVGAGAVRAVLGRIGWGEGSGADWWVDGTGRWGAGPARGAWAKDRAEFLGAGAREAHRRERLTVLRARAEELDAELASARAEVAAAEARAQRARDERAGYPAGVERELGAAQHRAAGAQQELERAHTKAQAAQVAWERAADEAAWALAELTGQAAELGVGPTVAETDAVLAAVTSYEVALGEARRTVRALADAATARQRSLDRAAESAETLSRRESDHRELRTRAAGLRARFEELHATVGASVTKLQARLDQTAAALGRVGQELRTIATEQLAAATRHGRLEENVRDLDRRRSDTAAAREKTIGALRSFVDTGLLRVALPELPVPTASDAEGWSLTAALALARTAEQQLTDVDETDDAWARAQQRVSGAATVLGAQMSRHGHTAFVEQRADVLVVRVRYLQDEVDVDRLAERLTQDVADRERLLSAREREILENHLVNEVAGHLHELLLTAEDQIDRMNRELAERKTSTGMQLRVRWRERGDGPAGLAAARRLMVRSGRWDGFRTGCFLIVSGGFVCLVPGLLDLVGGSVSECRVESLLIVPQLNVTGNIPDRVLASRVCGAMDSFDLQCGIERFCPGVIVANSGASH